MGNRYLVTNENINGILCPETITFPMMFLAEKHRRIEVGQHVNFWYSPIQEDKNGIKSYREKMFVFEALIYDYYFDQIGRIPEHLHFLCWGMPKTNSIDLLCKKMDISHDSFVAVVFFTKDLTMRNTSYE